jgi:hypothetical protein
MYLGKAAEYSVDRMAYLTLGLRFHSLTRCLLLATAELSKQQVTLVWVEQG